jgi:hypothetical protein
MGTDLVSAKAMTPRSRRSLSCHVWKVRPPGRPMAPWSTDAQVEQDLVVCRAVVNLFGGFWNTGE